MTVEQFTATERAVAEMWAQIIGVRPASVEDDFFDLGGQSLDLVRFIQEVSRRYAVDLELEDLFAADFTVAATARAIDTAGGGTP